MGVWTRRPWVRWIGLGLGAVLLGAAPTGAQEPAPHEPQPLKPTPDEAPTAPRLDLDGDPLPLGARVRLGSARFTHDGEVVSVAFSPDGKTVLSSSEEETRLWEWNTGKLLRETPVPQAAVLAPVTAAYAPDGKMLAVVDKDHSIQLVESATGRSLMALNGHADDVQALAFAAASGLLATGDNAGKIHLWELATARSIQEQNQAQALTPDLKHLIRKGQDAQLVIQHARSNKNEYSVAGPKSGSNVLVFSPDARFLAAEMGDTTALLWELPDPLGGPAQAVRELTPQELEGFWKTLADPDPAQAYPALWALVEGKDSAVVFLRERLRAAPFDPARLRQLVTHLDHEDMEVREAATKELMGLRALAAQVLREALQRNPSPEVQIRAKKILSEMNAPGGRAAGLLRRERALAVLEEVGSPLARASLEELAKALVYEREARMAREAVERVGRALRSSGKKPGKMMKE